MAIRGKVAVLLVGCIALACAKLVRGACPVSYSAADGSLLMGGTYGSCTSGCQPRNTIWSDVCKLKPDDYVIWGVCEDWQRSHAAQLAAAVPGLAEFTPCQLYEAIGNRTLWILGDSHVKGLWYSLRCFMLDFWNTSNGECAASSDSSLQAQLELTSLQGHPYNTPPRCIHFIGSSGRICMVHSPIGDYYVSNNTQVPGTLQLLTQNFTNPQDIIYISIGRWHANNCLGIHPSYATSLESIGAYVTANRDKLPNVLFGVAPHDHTECVGGELVFDVPACLPAEQGCYNISESYRLSTIAHDILGQQYNIPVIDYYNRSLALYDGHITASQSIAGVMDCLHFCRPGLGEMNIWEIYSRITTHILGVTPEVPSSTGAAAPAPAAAAYTCVPIEPVLPPPFGPTAGNKDGGPDTPVTGIARATARDAWGHKIPQNK